MEQLANVAAELMVDIDENSRMLQQGELTIQATYPRLSKKIIDKI